MSRCHAEKHSKQDMHVRRAENIKKRLSETRKPCVSAAAPVSPDPSLSPAGHDNFSIDFDCVDNTPIDMQADGPSMVPETDSEYPLADLWNQIVSSRQLQLDGEFPDLFAELQASVASGHIAISTPIVPTNKMCELVDDSASDFGIEIPVVSPDHPLYPWPSKAHFITSLLFSSPRLPFSEVQKKAVLSWAKELGKCQSHLQYLVGDPTEKVTSHSSNTFYINNIAKAIAKDYANPLTRLAMQDYPEDGGKGMLQVFNGTKMLLNLPSPPAVQVNRTVYFTDELLQESSGGYFIPNRFFLAAGDTPADTTESCDKVRSHLCNVCLSSNVCQAGFIVSDEEEIIPMSMFTRSFGDIAATCSKLDCGLTASSIKYASLSPNLLQEKSKGNISKQWNKHHAIYMFNANLPREMLEKEFFVRFVSSSPHALPMELMRAMRESISDAAQSGVIAWDCKYNEEVMLIPYVLFLTGDNPMQAEECSHAGLNCNYFCRTCEVGGTKEYKESEAGYNTIFTSGNLRTPKKTLQEIRQQFETAFKSGATTKIQNSVSLTGVRDSSSALILSALVKLGKKLRKQFEELLKGRQLNDIINPLLGMDGLDIHMDTPTEILHTILLGVVKYFWGQTVFLLEKAKFLHIFQCRLESIDKDGLNAPCLNADYICHYKGSLIGKHFKSLAQVMPFIIHDLVPPTVLNAWTVIGELVVLVWHTKITDTEAYLAILSRTIEDFLNVTTQCAPSILISKPKFHFLVHLPAYIRCFGPAIVFSTERYESFNHVFRLSCIHSNRQAPSRDTCRIFSHQDTVKYIATGGYWYDPTVKKWVCAGVQVLCYLDKHPEQAKLLGILNSSHNPPIPGSGKIETTTATATQKSVQKDVVPWSTTRCVKILGTARPGIELYQAKSVVTSEGEHLYIGRIREILVSSWDSQTADHVALQLFTFAAALHPSLHLPCIDLTNNEMVSTGIDIICAVNIQLNCLDSQCTDIQQQPVHQERIETSRTKATVKHKSMPTFFSMSIPCITMLTSNTPLRVTNAAERAAKKGGDTSQLAGSGEAPPSAFDHALAKPWKSAPKAKAKPAKASASGSSQNSEASMQHQIALQPPHPPHHSFPPPLPIPSLPPLHLLPPLHQSLPPLYCPPPQSYFPSQFHAPPSLPAHHIHPTHQQAQNVQGTPMDPLSAVQDSNHYMTLTPRFPSEHPQPQHTGTISGPSSSSRAPPLHQFQPFMSPAHHPPHNPHSGYPPQESQAQYLQSQHYYPQFGAPYPGGM
ncbi:hypothetical protein F4604DRAFT_1881049 [Suillus subluteus]|nr:hypothetical protein F4604DRAFT_1881049 [Suillus subluteus]